MSAGVLGRVCRQLRAGIVFKLLAFGGLRGTLLKLLPFGGLCGTLLKLLARCGLFAVQLVHFGVQHMRQRVLHLRRTGGRLRRPSAFGWMCELCEWSRRARPGDDGARSSGRRAG
jgi:hypothetical protein